MNNSKATPSLIFVVMAILFVITAIAGFAPTSLGLISRVTSGQEAVPPFVVHLHAASLSLWLVLLLTQSIFINRNRPDLHKKLGLFALVLAPCILFSMYGMEMLNVERSVAASKAVSTAQPIQNISSALLIHSTSYIFFPMFLVWALLVRRKDSETHKRMMFLATLALMIPAFGRLLSVTRVLPDFGFNLVDARHFYLLILIAPAFVYDIVRQRRPHPAYIIGVSLIGIWAIAAHFLWGSPWWVAMAPKLLGV